MKNHKPIYISKKLFPLSVFSILILFILPNTVYAVPPPDFLFNLGSQIAQFFSIAVLFLSAIFSVSYKYIQTRLALMKSNKLLFYSVIIVAIGGISGGAAYLYGNYKQNAEYQKWLTESQQYADLPKEEAQYLANKKIPRDQTPEQNTVDQLSIGENTEVKDKIQRSAESDEKFIANTKSENPNTQFIKTYYQAIALGNFEKAYEVSKKSVDFATFKGWYTNVSKITLDKITEISTNKSSLELTVYEGPHYTRYAVLMTLNIVDNKPSNIVNSEVKTLSEGQTATTDNTIANEQKQPVVASNNNIDNDNFYEKNKDSNLSISNSDFQKNLDGTTKDYLVLDAREDLEYSDSYFPGSTHIRFADLQAGEWIKVPSNKFIYVFCSSGIRGKEVATFLRSKKIIASYLENGAKGWIDSGGKWNGDVTFLNKYTDERYRKLFSKEEVKENVAKGVVLVDSRQPWKFEKYHLPGSINIPIMYTPSIDVEKTFAQVPAKSTIITICDEYVNCFDAKITGVELERRGHTFLGRYNKPWDYD